jgi:thiamine biosynthesis lipoprotein
LSPEHLNRRRAIAILAAGAATLAAGDAGSPEAFGDVAWEGTAMGADARIVLSGTPPDQARVVAALAVAEIERLERALSLYRGDSEISRLNRAGSLEGVTADFRHALALALSVAAATDGGFDPTVQALWEAHVDWFSSAAALPPEPLVEAAHARVDWRRIALAPDMIRLGADQRITLNGLAQGYVTDRIADLLRAQGLRHVLVDLGEQRALGPRQDGTPWLIAHDGAETLPLRHGALATSEGAGCVLGAAGAAHHLFDPRTGRSAGHWRRITVHHRSAAVADALSTALYATSAGEIAAVLARFPMSTVWALDRHGRQTRFSSAASG